MIVSTLQINCYFCSAVLIPYDIQNNALLCPQCGKVWVRSILKPTKDEESFIPGASHAMGGKSGKNKNNNKEKMKRPSNNMMFNKLFNQY